MKITDIVKNTPESIARFLDTAPTDELYTSVELSEKFKVSRSTITHSDLLSGYKVKFGEWNYYGSLKAIESFLKETNED